MSEDEIDKTIVPLSIKELLNYSPKYPPPVCPNGGPVLEINESDNLGNINLVKCKNSHFGPKILATHVTVHLPGKPEGKQAGDTTTFFGGKSKWLLCLAGALLLASAAVTMGTVFVSPGRDNLKEDDTSANEEVTHPMDWYYTRTDRNLSECLEESIPPRLTVIVDSAEGSCNRPDNCLTLVHTLDDGSTDFYLVGGRVYEGLGWNCGSPNRSVLQVVFIVDGQVPVSQLDMYSFNALVNLGVNVRELSNGYDLIPACCLHIGYRRPAKGVLFFIETLPTFRKRECLSKSGSCQ